MYISDLNIHGFKSFARKDTLRFGEGITAIVGPNGCGKTNIVDAIRWVLGEQKYSILRSGKMEDVIFGGADSMKPLSVCEVSLTVHNNKGKLPTEYNDVEIGRRIFRSGESEYFINRAPCRLKDIQDLFVDTGMGADAYSVIELKMIEQILSETTEERKMMFEEAAGINKYKQQRKSTLKKFEAVHGDLERVKDIMAEVESKVNALALQLKRFERHEKLTDELCQKEIALAFIKIGELQDLAVPLKKKIQDFKHLRQSAATESSTHEQELDRLKVVYQDQQKELDALQDDIGKNTEARDEARKNIVVAREKQQHTAANVDRLEKEHADHVQRIAQLNLHVADYQNEINKLVPQIDEKLQEYKQTHSAFTGIDLQCKNAQDAVEAMQNKRWDEQRKIADQGSLYNRSKDLLTEKEKQFQLIAEKEKNLLAVIHETSVKKSGSEKQLIQLKQDAEKQKRNLEKVEKEIEKFEKAKQETWQKSHALKTHAEVLEKQIKFYTNLLESKDGFSSGVQYVLKHPKEFSGVHGVLAELLTIDESFAKIIGNVLGELAGYLVVEDRKAAMNVIHKLKTLNQDGVSIIPLKEFSALHRDKQKFSNQDWVISCAADKVKAGKQYDKLVNILLGNVLIVSDLDHALQNEHLSGWDLVDLDGVFAGTNMILKRSGNGKSLMGRKETMQSLQSALSKNLKDQQTAEQNLNLIQATLKQAESQKALIQTELVNKNKAVSVLEQEGLEYSIRLKQMEEQKSSFSHESAELKSAIAALKTSLNKMSPSAQKGKKILTGLSEKLKESNEEFILLRTKRDELHKQVQDLRIAALNLENQRDNLHFQKKTAEQTIAEINERQNLIKKEIKELLAFQKELVRQIADGEKTLTKAEASVVSKRSVLDLKKMTAQETFAEIEKIQSLLREEQHSRENILEEMKTAELQMNELEQSMALIRERIKDRYHQAIPHDLPVTETRLELEERIEKINRSIENIGPVNMAVKDEYESETQRLQLLTTQKTDLELSETNLRDTIQTIDKEARKLFMDTFSIIKSNFEKLFTMFFEGGNGTLSLVGDPDPLESDIAIHAQPPGKRNSSLRMLSAGEKSLTAIALLFSIYQFKPSPYCILDEVDAPLDDVNVRKFTKVLKAFSKDTQFIVVTHNKLTMESADSMFGVTMEQKGVSKLVSVKFDA